MLQCLREEEGSSRTCLREVVLSLLLATLFCGCRYDYAALSGQGGQSALVTGASGGTVGPRGSGGAGGGSTAGTGGGALASSAGGSGAPNGGAGAPGASGGAGPSGTGGLGSGNDAGQGGGPGTTGADATGGSASGGNATGGDGAVTGTGGQGGTTAPGTGGDQTMGAAGAGGASEVVLSIDFVGGRWMSNGTGGMTLVPGVPMAASEVAGARPAAQWNPAIGPTGSLANLTLSNGGVTAATVGWQSASSASGPGEWNHQYSDAPGDVKMMNGYLDPLSSTSPATVMVSKLPTDLTAAGYDVYVYVSGEIKSSSTRTCRYTLGTTSLTVSEVGPTPTTFTGFSQARDGGTGNYIVFRKLTGAAFTLTATPGTTTPARAPIDGMQIVFPSAP